MNSLAWGPFMLYRNTPSVNQLSTLGSEHLKLMLNFPKILSFSEWGPRSKHSAAEAGISANFSITTLLADHCKELGLRIKFGAIPLVWDGCATEGDVTNTCSRCILRTKAGFPSKLLHQVKEDGKFRSVLLCNYQYTKHNISRELVDFQELQEEVLSAPCVEVGYVPGRVRAIRKPSQEPCAETKPRSRKTRAGGWGVRGGGVRVARARSEIGPGV